MNFNVINTLNMSVSDHVRGIGLFNHASPDGKEEQKTSRTAGSTCSCPKTFPSHARLSKRVSQTLSDSRHSLVTCNLFSHAPFRSAWLPSRSGFLLTLDKRQARSQAADTDWHKFSTTASPVAWKPTSDVILPNTVCWFCYLIALRWLKQILYMWIHLISFQPHVNKTEGFFFYFPAQLIVQCDEQTSCSLCQWRRRRNTHDDCRKVILLLDKPWGHQPLCRRILCLELQWGHGIVCYFCWPAVPHNHI